MLKYYISIGLKCSTGLSMHDLIIRFLQVSIGYDYADI